MASLQERPSRHTVDLDTTLAAWQAPASLLMRGIPWTGIGTRTDVEQTLLIESLVNTVSDSLISWDPGIQRDFLVSKGFTSVCVLKPVHGICGVSEDAETLWSEHQYETFTSILPL